MATEFRPPAEFNWLPAGNMTVRLNTGLSYSGLQRAVEDATYKPGWRFWLTGGPSMASGSVRQVLPEPSWESIAFGPAVLASPVFLHVEVWTDNSDRSGEKIFVTHTFLAPEYPPDGTFERWLLDRILDIERHEAMEFFAVGGRKPYYPEHGPGARPYDIRQR